MKGEPKAKLPPHDVTYVDPAHRPLRADLRGAHEQRCRVEANKNGPEESAQSAHKQTIRESLRYLRRG
jgi:hypothetical protein